MSPVYCLSSHVQILYTISMIVAIVFFLGLCVGSFLNVVINRTPKGESFLWGRSHCDHCKHQLRWYELLPLLSFFLQKGKSRCCKKSLSLEHPLVELCTGLGFVLLYYVSIHNTSGIIVGQMSQVFSMHAALFIIHYALCIILFCSLLIIFVSDWKTEIIPVEPMILSVVTALIFRILYFTNLMNLMNVILSAFFAWLFFFCLWFFSKGKAMGDGDMYLSFMIGLLLGFPYIIIALYAAFLTGAVVGVILILGRKKSLKAHIPFGPFLIWGLVVGFVWGDAILAMWRILL